MNFLFCDAWGGGLPIAYRLKSEGHNCRMFMDGKPEVIGNQGKGFVTIVKTPDSSYDWADLTIFTDGGDGAKAQELRRQYHNVWGGTPEADRLEADRAFGQEAMKKAGIPIVPYRQFKALGEAITWVTGHSGRRYAVKLSGKDIEDEKSTSYVGKENDCSDLIDIIEQFKRFGDKIETVFIQDFVDGVEVGIAGHFNGTDFVEPIEVSFEHKALMNDKIGPGTGEMGTTARFVDRGSKVYLQSIKKMIPYLTKESYVGYFCIGCIANSTGLWPLEMTTRIGFPTINLYLENVLENFGEFLYELSSGGMGRVKMKNPFVSCLVVATPPFPFQSPEIAKHYSTDMLISLKKDQSGIWPSQVYDDNGKWRCASQDGYSLVVTGSGKTMHESIDQMYARKKNVRIPNELYRTDIGSTYDSDLAKLKSWGWM